MSPVSDHRHFEKSEFVLEVKDKSLFRENIFSGTEKLWLCFLVCFKTNAVGGL